MSERPAYGVDFGTSNSAIASSLDGTPELVELDSRHNKSQPSCIFIRIDGYHSTGHQAIDDLQTASSNDIYHFIPSVKPGLPYENYEGNALIPSNRSRTSPRFFPVEDLASFVVSDLKSKAENKFNESIEQAAVGRPVKFSEDPVLDTLAQTRLETAARIAGFKEIIFVEEPVAAAIHYERFSSNPDEKKVMVFDFGGGTLDTCILELNHSLNNLHNNANLNRRILATYGIDLGGNDLDKDLFYEIFPPYFGSNATWTHQKLPVPLHIISDITEWHLQDYEDQRKRLRTINTILGDKDVSDREAIQRLLTLVQDQQVYELLQSIENAKITLSHSSTALINRQYKNININKSISDSEYEALITHRCTQIKQVIEETLKLAQLDATEIDTVIRVGGSSKNAFVESILLEYFSNLQETDPFFSIVSGLSLAAESHFI